MTKKAPAKKPAAAKPAKAAKPAEAAKVETAPAAKTETVVAKPAVAKKPVFQAPPKPGGNFPGQHQGKGGPKPNNPSNSPKGRIFRHQGR